MLQPFSDKTGEAAKWMKFFRNALGIVHRINKRHISDRDVANYQLQFFGARDCDFLFKRAQTYTSPTFSLYGIRTILAVALTHP